MHRIYASFASKKERDFMWDFLDTQDFSLFDHSEAGEFVLKKGEDMGFAPRAGGLILGFECKTLPQKMWALLAWVSLRSSVRINGWAAIRMNDEEIPVLISDRIHDEDALFVNEDGLLNSWIERELPIGPNPLVQQKFLLALSRRWDEHTKKKKTVVPTRTMMDSDTFTQNGFLENGDLVVEE